MSVARGRFITFEGGEGAGKSTQARLLAERLSGLGVEVIQTREPGGSPLAERLRTAILSGAVAPLGPMAEALAFSAARIDHLDKLIRPALDRGAWVICDRFLDSTRAYQGAQGAIDPGAIRALESIVVGETWPDLTIILDLPATTGLERAAARRGGGATDRFEGEAITFHEGLRKAFLDIARNEPDRALVIDATRQPDDVAADVWRSVRTRLGAPDATSQSARRNPS